MGDRSYSEEASSDYSESPKSSEGGLRGALALAPLAPTHGRAESGEVKKKKRSNDQEQVKKTARASGLFKGDEG